MFLIRPSLSILCTETLFFQRVKLIFNLFFNFLHRSVSFSNVWSNTAGWTTLLRSNLYQEYGFTFAGKKKCRSISEYQCEKPNPFLWLLGANCMQCVKANTTELPSSCSESVNVEIRSGSCSKNVGNRAGCRINKQTSVCFIKNAEVILKLRIHRVQLWVAAAVLTNSS